MPRGTFGPRRRWWGLAVLAYERRDVGPGYSFFLQAFHSPYARRAETGAAT